MDVWSLLFTILGWVLLLILTLVAVFIISGVIVYIVNVSKAGRTQTKLKQQPAISDKEVLRLSAKYYAEEYDQACVFSSREVVFEQGVKFALAAKQGQYVDSV